MERCARLHQRMNLLNQSGGSGGPRVALMASPKHLVTVVLEVRSPREGPVSYTLLPWVVPARVAGKGRVQTPMVVG